MSPSSRPLLGLGIAGSLALAAGCAQMPELPGLGPSGPVKPASASATNSGLPAAHPASGIPREVITPNPKALAELLPDKTCGRPQENFDVMQKALFYGGTVAQLRLQRLIASNFAYSDLTEQDHALLKYLAYTTVWIPVSIEGKIGSLYSALAMNTASGSKSGAAQRVTQRLELFKSQVKDFPGRAELVVLKELKAGAFARPGGLITVSLPFASLLDSDEGAMNLVVAHELSHLYKRHSMKNLQFKLISTSAGFTIAQKLLSGFGVGSSSNPLQEIAFVATTFSQLSNFVNNANLQFDKNQELEADACAVAWMVGAKVDPSASLRAFSRLASAHPDDEYFPSHPTTKEREANFACKLNPSLTCNKGAEPGAGGATKSTAPPAKKRPASAKAA